MSLTVVYKNTELSGQVLQHKDTLSQPSIELKRKPVLLYTLIMVDPDAKPKDYLHWLVVNIDRANYQDIVDYVNPDKPHNFVFYLCEQPKWLRIKPLSGRSGFNTNQFILDYHLTVVDRKSFKSAGP
jgi:hypothetical protein